jgi:hypothetical protein
MDWLMPFPGRSMQPLEYPLAFGQWTVHRGALVCRMPRKVVTVAAPGRLLRAVQEACDGRTAWKQAAQVLARRWPAEDVHAFLAGLAASGVLVESAESLATAIEGAQSAPPGPGSRMKPSCRPCPRAPRAGW